MTKTTINLFFLFFFFIQLCTCQTWFSILDPLPFGFNSSSSYVSVQLFNPLCKLQLASRCDIQLVNYFNFSIHDPLRSIYKSFIPVSCPSRLNWNVQVFCAGIPNQFQTVRWLASAPECASLYWSVSKQTCTDIQLDIVTPFDAWLITPDNPDIPYVIPKKTSFSSITKTRIFNTTTTWSMIPMVRECMPQSISVPFDESLIKKCKPKENNYFSTSLSLAIESLNDNTVLGVSWLFISVAYGCGLLFGTWQKSIIIHQYVVCYTWIMCSGPALYTLGFSLFIWNQLVACLISILIFILYHILLFMKTSKKYAEIPIYLNSTNITTFTIFLCTLLIVCLSSLLSK